MTKLLHESSIVLVMDDELNRWIDEALAADPMPLEIISPDPDYGPIVSADELVSAANRLTSWQLPATFIATVKELCGRCTEDEFFRNSRLNFLQDAFVMAELVRLKPVDQVRLATKQERWPDGLVKINGKAHNVEVTGEHLGRKLGDEYRKGTAPGFETVKDWAKRNESIPYRLDRCIRHKVAKHYGSQCWLIVYLNANDLGTNPVETTKAIAAIKERHANKFTMLSVLYNGKLH